MALFRCSHTITVCEKFRKPAIQHQYHHISSHSDERQICISKSLHSSRLMNIPARDHVWTNVHGFLALFPLVKQQLHTSWYAYMMLLIFCIVSLWELCELQILYGVTSSWRDPCSSFKSNTKKKTLFMFTSIVTQDHLKEELGVPAQTVGSYTQLSHDSHLGFFDLSKYS